MVYSVWLLGLRLCLLQRSASGLGGRSSERFRRGIASDLFYLIFNSEYLGVLIGVASIHAVAALDRSLDLTRLREHFYLGAMTGSLSGFSSRRLFSSSTLPNGSSTTPFIACRGYGSFTRFITASRRWTG
jgi:hypothetical protein